MRFKMYPNAGIITVKHAPPGISSRVLLQGYIATYTTLHELGVRTHTHSVHTVFYEQYVHFFFPLIIHLLFKPHVYIPSQVRLRWAGNTGLTFQRGWTLSGYLRSRCGKWLGHFLCLWPGGGRKRKAKSRKKTASFKMKLIWKSSLTMVV